MSNPAKKWIPEGWHLLEEPDLGVGFQIQSDDSLEDDEPALSVSFYDDVVNIHYTVAGFGSSASHSLESEWDGDNKSIEHWVNEATRMARRWSRV